MLRTIGFAALLAYLFVLISRVLDVTFPQLRIPMVLYVVMVSMALLSGMHRVFKRQVNWWFGLYLIWMGFAVPFSHWRSGSVSHWMNALKIFIFFLCIQALATSWKKLRVAIWALALGLLVAAILSRLIGDFSTGRLKLEVGTLSDPNDFAMYMIMGLCLWLLLWQTTKNPVMTSVLYVPPLLLMLAAFMSTGSRGGLVALAAVFLAWMVHMTMKGKLMLVAVLCIIVPVAPLFMSDYVKSRFLTISSVDSEDAMDQRTADMLGSSIASTESRKELILQSLRITAAHPLFGIGPGMFPVYTDFLAKQAGRSRGQWQPTHNLFTQISSECGIPALLLYLLGIGNIVFSLRRVRRSKERFADADDMRQAAGYLLMALYGLIAAGMFLSIAYTTAIYVIAALAVVLSNLHEMQAIRARATSATQPVPPSPSPVRLTVRPAQRFPQPVPRLGARG
jgi:O-antigen ligase